MAFQMKISVEPVKDKDVAPGGLYKLRFIGFKPKYSALKPGEAEGTKTSLNYNAKMEILDHPDHAGKFVYAGLNEKANWVIEDFCHGFGFPVETDGNSIWFPGQWDGTEGDASTYIYHGPLTGQIAEVELGISSYNNKPKNEVSRYICRVKDCAQKFPKLTHSMNLLRKN